VVYLWAGEVMQLESMEIGITLDLVECSEPRQKVLCLRWCNGELRCIISSFFCYSSIDGFMLVQLNKMVVGVAVRVCGMSWSSIGSILKWFITRSVRWGLEAAWSSKCASVIWRNKKRHHALGSARSVEGEECRDHCNYIKCKYDSLVFVVIIFVLRLVAVKLFQ
jgi:hypothetical protein